MNWPGAEVEETNRLSSSSLSSGIRGGVIVFAIPGVTIPGVLGVAVRGVAVLGVTGLSPEELVLPVIESLLSERSVLT